MCRAQLFINSKNKIVYTKKRYAQDTLMCIVRNVILWECGFNLLVIR